MSSTTSPISPAAFASALKELPLSALHLKAAELRNSIAHLDYSNEQLRPFALGTEPGLTAPDDDCLDAIKENEVVIARMEERIRLLKKEVEDRGQVWVEGMVNGERNGEVLESAEEPGELAEEQERSNAWSDGTFTVGRIVGGELVMDDDTAPTANGTGVNGVNGMVSAPAASSTNGAGGRLDDDTLRRAMEERMRDLATEDDDGGMHL